MVTARTKTVVQNGQEFVEIDVDDHPNITITRGGTILVAVREHPDQTGVNVLTMPPKHVDVLVNNKRVDVW